MPEEHNDDDEAPKGTTDQKNFGTTDESKAYQNLIDKISAEGTARTAAIMAIQGVIDVSPHSKR